MTSVLFFFFVGFWSLFFFIVFLWVYLIFFVKLLFDLGLDVRFVDFCDFRKLSFFRWMVFLSFICLVGCCFVLFDIGFVEDLFKGWVRKLEGKCLVDFRIYSEWLIVYGWFFMVSMFVVVLRVKGCLIVFSWLGLVVCL